ncbi:hypothetical protein [Hydrocoleum sp. CS-953]|uniref:hypothetical protein n=1 Tax=Microcoleaceae TaxID=1892252 RepID=UPI000B9A5164|nr:hypothetical protein [Hydrocoleum sp. CS-953]OZH51502.1 hypothetical protein AFK68_30660 [Hydrocoleum sp. CS-953]
MTFTRQPQPKLLEQEFPSQAISLYDGSAELIDGENTIRGEALIQISWYPFPFVSVKFVYYGEGLSDDIELNLDNTELKLAEINLVPRMKVVITKGLADGTGKRERFGYLKEPLIQGRTDNLSSVTFQIANFLFVNFSNDNFEYDDEGNETEIEREFWLPDSFGAQVIFEYGGWHIVLARLDDPFDFEKRLEAEGGYGISHICKIKRLDSKNFDLRESYEVINAFIYYISFLRGIWIAPLYILGFDAEGNQVLEEWRTPTIKADSWQSPYYSWGWDECAEVVDAFPGFMKKWQDETWQEVIQNSIQWYIEGYKHTNGYNSSIILVHSALEKIAWTHLNSNNYISSVGFQKLSSDDKIRLLLKTLNISLIPVNDNWEIIKLAKAYNWGTDELGSISIIMQVRNLLIHPKINKKENKIKLTESMMEEVFVVAHNYLLKCLLKLFDYPYGIDTYKHKLDKTKLFSND